MWMRRILWPILAVIIIFFELWAVFDGIPGNTITEWVTDFPKPLWGLVIGFLIWLGWHLYQWRKHRRVKQITLVVEEPDENL